MENKIPISETRHWEINTVRGTNSSPIRYGYYCKSSAPKEALLFINGRGEWIEKYHFLPTELSIPDDWCFITLDHRGQGGSAGLRSHIDDYDTYSDDLQAVLQKLNITQPITIIGHSMGGLISLNTIITGKVKPKKLVLTSPLLGFNINKKTKLILDKLIKILSKTSASRLNIPQKKEAEDFPTNPYTHHADRYNTIIETPYKIPSPTIGWTAATLRCIAKAFSKDMLANIDCPVMLITGSRETIVDPEMFLKWSQTFSKLSKRDFQRRQIQGARHEILNESKPYSQLAMEDIKTWLFFL